MNVLCQLGYWIIEALVNRATEFYPRGGIKQLVRLIQLTHDVIHVYYALYSDEA